MVQRGGREEREGAEIQNSYATFPSLPPDYEEREREREKSDSGLASFSLSLPSTTVQTCVRERDETPLVP